MPTRGPASRSSRSPLFGPFMPRFPGAALTLPATAARPDTIYSHAGQFRGLVDAHRDETDLWMRCGAKKVRLEVHMTDMPVFVPRLEAAALPCDWLLCVPKANSHGSVAINVLQAAGEANPKHIRSVSGSNGVTSRADWDAVNGGRAGVHDHVCPQRSLRHHRPGRSSVRELIGEGRGCRDGVLGIPGAQGR